MHRHIAVGVATWLAVPGAAYARTAPEAQVIVRVYNIAGVAPADLETAQATAMRVLKSASIVSAWRDCASPFVADQDCSDPLGPREVVVRLVSSAGSDAPTGLGYSLVDVRARAGTLATVFADRVASIAARTDFDAGRLIGLAVAHEIGHLLLGTAEHATCGLMRARWFEDELRRDRAADWAWSRGEEAAMRRGLAARPRLREPATLLVASEVQ